MADDSLELTDQQKKRLHGMHLLLGAILDGMRLRGLRSPPVSLIQTFFEVCRQEGLSVDEYAKRVEIPQTTMSRHLLDLGDHNRKMEPGLGLVTSRPGDDGRRHEYILTERGRLLRDKTASLVEEWSR
jgi:DNA-binding transcriptional ArsR family regulator